MFYLDISPEIKARRRIFEIVDAVQSGNPRIFSIRPAFDGKKISSPLGHSSLVEKQVFSLASRGRGPSMNILVTFAWCSSGIGCVPANYQPPF